MIFILSLFLLTACDKTSEAPKHELLFLAKGVKVDAQAKLLWQDQAINKNNEQTWSKAQEYCQNLVIDDFIEWRLPTRVELEHLITQKHRLDEIALFSYWSATKFQTKRDTAYFSYFGDGCLRNNASMQKHYLVRCVHSSL